MNQNKPSSTHHHQQHTPQTGQEHGRVHQVQDHEHHDKNQLGHEKQQAGHVDPNELRTPPKITHTPSEMAGLTIFIDHKPYHVVTAKFSGADVRALSNPPIGPDKNVFRVVSGKGDDIQVGDSDVITVSMREVNQGRHFFSDTIVPSKDAIARKAYFIYLDDGSHPGHDKENWAKAESQIDPQHK